MTQEDGLKNIRAIADALKFYGGMDKKAGVPAAESPAVIAMQCAEELHDHFKSQGA